MQEKIDFAIRLIQAAAAKMNGQPIEVAYSGGKDSDVILQLTKEAGVPYKAIHKATTIDPPLTIRHAREMGAEVIRPRQTFFQLIEKKGFPNRWRRFCCAALKEYKILDKQIIGVRAAESTRRKNRYKEPTQCRIYSSKERTEQIYPILYWDNEDLLDYISDRQIRLHPLYYREDGSVDVSRRLGCLGCPLATRRKQIADFQRYPNLVKAYTKAGATYMARHKECPSLQRYEDAYGWFYRHLFCKTNEEFDEERYTLFGKTDFKAFLEDFFKIQL